MTTTTPQFDFCSVEPCADNANYVTVWFHWRGVDRPRTYGITARKGSVERRLVRAAIDGAVFGRPTIRTDIAGQTYVNEDIQVRGKRLSSGLQLLGY